MEVDNLVRTSQEGDGDSFWKLVEPELARLLAFMRSRIRNIEDARDLAQDVVLAAFTNLPTLRNPASFTSWFWAIARNKVKDWYKDLANAHLSITDLSEADHGAAACNPAADAYDLWEEVHALPADLSKVVCLKYAASFTSAEIAHLLDKAESTVNSWLREARKLLLDRWKTGGDSGSEFVMPICP